MAEAEGPCEWSDPGTDHGSCNEGSVPNASMTNCELSRDLHPSAGSGVTCPEVLFGALEWCGMALTVYVVTGG